MYDPGTGILTIEWKIEDIMSALKDAEVEPSEENIDKLLRSDSKWIKTLGEDSIELGWCRINGMIENIFHIEK